MSWSRPTGARPWTRWSAARARSSKTYTGGVIGIYSSGQLMLQEPYTLAVVGKAGLRTVAWRRILDRLGGPRPPKLVVAIDPRRTATAASIRLLGIIATNPAVSMPDLPRIRSILRDPGLFVVVQDALPTETTAMADLVPPPRPSGARRPAAS